MSTAMQNTAPIASHFIPGQHFWRHSRFSPQTTRTTHSWTTTTSLSSTSKHNFCYTMATISHSHFQQCLNLTMHITLRHLAAKMPSQLYNNFISFLPSYETCSINVNPLFHAAIKTFIYKPYSIFVFSLLYFPTTFSEQRKHFSSLK